ncbi:alpha/beta hydrolase [Streptomyces sp. NBC_00264]|uniref:alpha/beta fold hydrolase n=1 Tax=unclassified Streptomyces TaxID=2593676 RepID=UPI000F5BB21A|nr:MULTISPECIES: alpha/beta hydrolase [unclassified Streptomyces]WSX03850.1 alpha/beta hydrolase [Streptomyces sp. NBC_00987]MCX4394118.1 alpha/beta hydrolase [Streptomyces sp. NBC_01767]MCX5106068.1 alpha/beta hydrolase [Streptomyces sp. NBC_00439]MCX5162788.1 alpha/beta hydrolase [Streptomyces sp. NBC_00305]MCX5221305.1 alpha/beta hydrolase [Streptomyces sp. NBC_00264]
MSRPHTFTPPPCAHAHQLRTSRGDFAVLDASPPGAVRGTALLLPGYMGSKEDFVALLEPLSAAGYRTVAVDGRGQYETDGTDRQEDYAQGELARDVLAQATALGGAGTVHLLGHSLGGQIARAAVLLDASPFRSLTLMSSGPAEVVEAQQLKVKVLGDALATMSMARVWEAMRALDPPEEVASANGEALRRRWLRHRPAQLITTGRLLVTEPDRVAELAAVPLPVHVLSGERDDTWPVPLLDDMARRLGAHRTRIAGAEHSPNTDRPQETAAAIATFWDSL